MRITKKILSMLLAVVMVLGLLPVMASAAEGEYVYLSISFDGKYIDDKNGKPMAYLPVPLDDIAAVDLTAYGLENMWFDGAMNEDGSYKPTALQLLIYAHEELYGGDWSDVNFDALPGSSYFAGGIFGFTENLVYFHNGDFPVDETQQSDSMTVGATSDRIVLEAGDFLDVASFSCYGFLWDTQGGFHLFADENGNYVHDYNVKKGQALPVKLMHSFCDLMYGQSWVKDAADYEVYYGSTFGEAEGTVMTDSDGNAEITFPEAGVYYIWCDGDNGADDGTHSSCDYYWEMNEPCIVSAPAYAKVTVAGEEAPDEDAPVEKFDFVGANMELNNSLAMNFVFANSYYSDWTGFHAEIIKENADGSEAVKIEIPAEDWATEGDYFKITYNGVAAKEMTDNLYVTIYNAEGEAVSNTRTDSVSAYARRTLDHDASTKELKTVIVDMLNYGAAAQDYFDYAEQKPATYVLTEDEKLLASAEVEVSNSRVKGTNCLGGNVALESNIQLNLAFRGMTEDMTAKATFIDARGKECTANGEVELNSGYGIVHINALAVADYNSLVEVTVYNADGTVYSTASDSVASYVARNNADTGAKAELKTLCKVLAQFAESARAYFVD